MYLTLATLPWLLLLASLLFLLRRRPRLQDYAPEPWGRAMAGAGAGAGAGVPRVSVILPTHDDARQVGVCLASLLGSDYPDLEVIVVDHESRDGTREVVEALSQRATDRVRLLRTGEVPEDRPWRSWACEVGARAAAGELLLFTEPGTVHAPDLLGRAVSALREEEADLLTVQPRLTMHGFWERLVMPHVWLVLRARFPSARLVNRSQSPLNAVAHHQFLLFRREAYERIGGHAVVRRGAIEDLAVPQAVVAAGLHSFLVHGDRYLETRMFRTLRDITSDWTAAVAPASRTTVVPWARVLIPWVVVATPLVFFVLPPVLLLLGLLAAGWGGLAAWGLRTTLLSLLFWLAIYTVHRIRPAYAVAFPAGALAASIIFARSMLGYGRSR